MTLTCIKRATLTLYSRIPWVLGPGLNINEKASRTFIFVHPSLLLAYSAMWPQLCPLPWSPTLLNHDPRENPSFTELLCQIFDLNNEKNY